MAKTKYWWPATIANQLLFWANFISKLPMYATALNITTDEITAMGKDAASFIYLYTYEAVVRAFLAAFMTYRRNLLTGKTPADIGAPPVCLIDTVPTPVLSALLNRLFAFVVLLKAQPGMTEAIRKDLQIVGDDIAPFVPADYIANGKSKVAEDGIIINFTKGLFIDGVAVFMQRGSDPAFYEIIRISKKGYMITSLNLAPGPETRNFKTRAYIDNVLIGFSSPVFSATWTSPPPPPTVAAAKDGAEAKTEEPKS
jgi:hypothetical protein